MAATFLREQEIKRAGPALVSTEGTTPEVPPESQVSWEEFRNVRRDLIDNVVNLSKGVAAGNIGTPVDLMTMATLVGYQGLNWIRGGSFTGLPEAMMTPGSTDSIGEVAFNADIDSAPFIVGSMLSPAGIVKGFKTVAGVATAFPDVVSAMFVGGLVKTQAITKRLDTARSMHKAGKTDESIWDETGWYPDGVNKAGEPQWKYVLSDADSIVDSNHIRELANASGLGVGQEGLVSTSLGNLFQHPTLYDAYPELRNIPIDVFLKRSDDVDGIPSFKVYNQANAERGITGATSTNLATGEKRVKLINDAAGDFGRGTILHEVQHLVQAIEGFDQGTTTAKWVSVVAEAQSARVDKILTEDLVTGRVGLDISDVDFKTYVDEVMAKTRASASDIARRLDQFIANGDSRTAAIAASEATRTERDLRVMLEVMADSALDAGERADHIIQNLPIDMVRKLAHSRYWRQGGEVEARLTEHLKDVSQEALLGRPKPPRSGEVSPGRQIKGDETATEKIFDPTPPPFEAL